MTLDIETLIALLDGHPGWRFFDWYGNEFVYNAKKGFLEYSGWDTYNDCPDVRTRHIRTPRKLMKKVGSEFMFARAAVDGNILRLWTAKELDNDNGRDPEMTLHVLEPVDLMGAVGEITK